MKCPKCTKRPMSFLRFAFTMDPTETTCSNCGTKLVATSKWRTFSKVSFWVSLGVVLLVILNGIGFLIYKQFPIPYFGYVFLFLLVVGISLDVVSFIRFEYEQALENPQGTSK